MTAWERGGGEGYVLHQSEIWVSILFDPIAMISPWQYH